MCGTAVPRLMRYAPSAVISPIFGISQEITGAINVSARSPARLVVLEIFFCSSLEDVRCCSLGVGLSAGWVLAEFDERVKLLRDLADGIDIGLGRDAEIHSPLFGAKLILKDERPRPAVTNPQTEPRQYLIKKYLIALAGRQLCGRHRRRR